jgi:hypothetical protein
MIPILTGVRLKFSVVFICFYFIAREFQYFIMYLLATCTSSFQRSLFSSCAISFFGFWYFGGWNLSFLQILAIRPLLIFWSYLSHIRANMWCLSFWTWLTLLNMILPVHPFTCKWHVHSLLGRGKFMECLHIAEILYVAFLIFSHK